MSAFMYYVLLKTIVSVLNSCSSSCYTIWQCKKP